MSNASHGVRSSRNKVFLYILRSICWPTKPCVKNSLFIFISCWLHRFFPVHWDQTTIIVCQSVGSTPILVLELVTLVPRLFGTNFGYLSVQPVQLLPLRNVWRHISLIWPFPHRFESMAKILISRNISIELRSLIAKCYIWSTLLYGAETWTLTKVTSDKLEAFEMWLYRRMLRISWKEHKTNGDVLHKMKTKRSLLNTIKKRKCQYFGHIIRGDGVQRLLMEGRINGRRGRGRPRTMWTDNIKEWTKMSYNDCIRVAQDRERWRSMTTDLLTTDGT